MPEYLIESHDNHICSQISCELPQDIESPMNISKPFNLSATLLIGVLLSSISLTVSADDFQDANQLFRQGNHSQALSKVNNYLAKKPKDAQGRFLKGLIYTEQGQVSEAIKTFTGLTQDYPDLPEPYNNLAVLYASQGQFEKAKSSLEMAIRTHPSYATAHENLGDIYAKMASQAYNRALQLDSSNTTTQTKLAMIQDLFTDKPSTRTSIARNTGNGAVNSGAVSRPQVVATAPVAAAPAAPAPIAKTSPAPSASNDSSDVLSAVDAWAASWSSKNVKQYLSHYTSDFRTPAGESRSAWAATRKSRIDKPRNISVKISNASVNFTDDNHATVKFHQDYRASNFKASGSKTLLMVKSRGQWLIQEENAR